MTTSQKHLTYKEEIDELIIDSLTQSITAHNAQRLLEWRNASPENEAYFRQIQDIWFSLSVGQSPRFSRIDAEAGYQEFLRRVEAAQGPASLPATHSHFRWIRYAAAVVLLAACTYWAYWQGNIHAFDENYPVRIEAPAGSHTLATLPDGTKVRLAGGSYLLYSPRFGADDREVTLTGEGYFEVAHNEEVPFLVHSPNLEVRVLGTKFNFRNYPEDKQAIVTLTEGKVNLHNLIAHSQQVMRPGEQAILNKQDGTLTLHKLSRKDRSQYSVGTLSFDEVPLEDVLKALARRYGTEFIVRREEVKKLPFYGEFDTDALSLEQVMELLSSTRQIRYHIIGKQVILD